MARDLFTNQASTTVAASKTAPAAGTSESWTVASSSAFPSASNSASPATQFYVADPNAPTELILVTNVSGTTWTVTRGADGTTPVTHSSGFTVKNVVPAAWLQRIADRLTKYEFNVRDFGALGNDSNDESSAFQGALNAARDNDGGTVYIPKGEYRINTLPLKVYQGTHIIADPEAHIMAYSNTSSFVWNGTGGDAFNGYEGNGNITIEGGIWDNRGGVFQDGGACFSFAHGKNLTWRDVTIRDVADTHAIEINGCQNVRIINCTFEGFYASVGREYSEAVQLDLMKSSSVYGAFGNYDHTPCDDVLVDGCRFQESGSASTGKWGRGVGSHNSTIGKWHTNIRVTNNHFSVNHEAVRGYSWNKTVVANNTLEECGSGIELRSVEYGGVASENTKNASGVQQNSSQDFQDFTITGNVISGTEASSTALPAINIIGEATGKALNGSITGNTITDCGTSAMEIESAARINVSGNTIMNTGAFYGILLDTCTDSLVANNKIEESATNSIMATLGTRNMISNNLIRLAGDRAIYISGEDDCVVQGNYVYGASRNDGTVPAFYSDASSAPVRWADNVARTVGSGNDYTYALHVTSGTHHIRGNDFQKGATGRLSLAGTIQGMTMVVMCTNISMGATGLEAMEFQPPTSGYIRRFTTRLFSSGSTTTNTNFRPKVYDSSGTLLATLSGSGANTDMDGVTEDWEYEVGQRIQVEQYSAGSSPVGLMCTFWLIENGSDL